MPARTSPVQLNALYDQQLAPVKLGAVIGEGHEGTVRATSSHSKTVAKIIRQQPLTDELADKLSYMVANPPPVVTCSAYRLAWPTSVIKRPKRAGKTIGYLMPALDLKRYREIGAYFNPARRRQHAEHRDRPYTYLHLLVMAQNLAHAIDHIHAQGHVIGDLNSRNVLANERGRIAIIDTDSFQIRDEGKAVTYRCAVGTPEYTTPRLQGIPFTELDQRAEDDQFALAVMIYQLLFQGQHPFAGQYRDSDGNTINTLADRIRVGTFVHGTQTKVKHRPTAGPAVIWQDSPFKKQFRTAFRRRGKRTTAEEWIAAFDHAANELHQCYANPTHWYLGSRCTWCAYQKRTGVDPFPIKKLATRRQTRTRRVRAI